MCLKVLLNIVIVSHIRSSGKDFLGAVQRQRGTDRQPLQKNSGDNSSSETRPSATVKCACWTSKCKAKLTKSNKRSDKKHTENGVRLSDSSAQNAITSPSNGTVETNAPEIVETVLKMNEIDAEIGNGNAKKFDIIVKVKRIFALSSNRSFA